MLYHMETSQEKVIHSWVRGRVNVMIDLVRHEFMGPQSSSIHFRSTAVTTNTVLRTIHMFAAQNTRPQDMVRPAHISTKVYPQSCLLLLVCPEVLLLRSAGLHKEVLARGTGSCDDK